MLVCSSRLSAERTGIPLIVAWFTPSTKMRNVSSNAAETYSRYLQDGKGHYTDLYTRMEKDRGDGSHNVRREEYSDILVGGEKEDNREHLLLSNCSNNRMRQERQPKGVVLGPYLQCQTRSPLRNGKGATGCRSNGQPYLHRGRPFRDQLRRYQHHRDD